MASPWISSYGLFGAVIKFFAIADSKGEIISAIPVVHFKLGFLKIIFIPHGPAIDCENQAFSGQILEAVEDYAKNYGAAFVQIEPYEPSKSEALLRQEADRFSLNYNPEVLAEANIGLSQILLEKGYERKAYFDLLRAPTEGQIVKVGLTDEELLSSFRADTRRNIKASLSVKDLEIQSVTSEPEVWEAYQVLRENAQTKKYPLRPWAAFKSALIPGIANNVMSIFLARYRGLPCATAVIGFGGKRGAYVMGGVKRMDYRHAYPAHLVQFIAMKATRERGFKEYDLTIPGESGVGEFKRGFRPDYYRLTGAYTRVFRPFQTGVYLRFYPFLKKNRRFLANLVYSAARMMKRARNV